MDQTPSAPPGKPDSPGAVSLCAAFFSESLEAIEARELALALAAIGLKVHLKPRWFEETGIEREERGSGQNP